MSGEADPVGEEMAIPCVQFTTGDEATFSEEHSILDIYEFKETYVSVTEGGLCHREPGAAERPSTHRNSPSD